MIALAAPPVAYIADLSNTVTVVDTLTNEVIGSINPSVAAGLTGVAVSPDGSTLYIADGNHTIHIVHSPTHNPTIDPFHLDDSLTPIYLVVTPDGSSVYASNAGSNTVTVLDTATKAIATVDIACNQSGTNNCSSLPPIAVTPTGNAINVYVGTNVGFAVINTSTRSLTTQVPTMCGRDPCAPLGIATSSDGVTVFVTLFEIDQLLGIEVAMNLVNDIATVGMSPIGLAVTPDGDTVYVANMNANSVSVVNVSSCGPVCDVTTISSGIVTEPQVVAITPDGGNAYVGGTASALSVIDTSSNSVTATVQGLTSSPWAIAIGPGDSDDDGIPDALEGSQDTDGDGMRDSRDTDADGDSIPDSVEAGPDPEHPIDTDGDGTPDYKDTDSDGDGIPDEVELGQRTDNDGCAVSSAGSATSSLLYLLFPVLILLARPYTRWNFSPSRMDSSPPGRGKVRG